MTEQAAEVGLVNPLRSFANHLAAPFGEESMKDIRPPFDDAVSKFKEFLQGQGWSDNLLWLSRDRITGHRTTVWVFRPHELASDATSRSFYEQARNTESSIRIDALCSISGRTLAYVEDYGGNSRLLNYGIHESPRNITVVSSSLVWKIVRAINAFRGESPFIIATKITGAAEPKFARD